jgi:hypothetical protein
MRSQHAAHLLRPVWLRPSVMIIVLTAILLAELKLEAEASNVDIQIPQRGLMYAMLKIQTK